MKEKDWMTTAEVCIVGNYKTKKLQRLISLGIIPAMKRNREKPWYIRPWIFEAHLSGYNVSKVPADISQEEFLKLLPTLRRG